MSVEDVLENLLAVVRQTPLIGRTHFKAATNVTFSPTAWPGLLLFVLAVTVVACVPGSNVGRASCGHADHRRILFQHLPGP